MELKIDSINVKEFQNFIDKLLAIDKFIFMKMSSTEASSSVYFAQRDAVKQVTIETNKIFTITEKFSDIIKISFFDGSRIIDALSQFSTDDIKGKIIYQKHGGELIASDFIVYNDFLEIKLFCSDPSLNFMDMNDEEKSRAFGTSGALFEFELGLDHVEKMKSLFKLDKEKETFIIQSKMPGKDGIFIVGSNYNQILTSAYKSIGKDSDKVTVYKKYLPLLDKESYNVTVCENKVVLKSNESKTYLTIAVCVLDEENDVELDSIDYEV